MSNSKSYNHHFRELDVGGYGDEEINPEAAWTEARRLAEEYNRDLKLRILDKQVGSGMRHR